MKRIVLHIGLDRTGSSAIQRFMTRNRLALRLMGVRYPRLRGPDGNLLEKHQDLVAAIAAQGRGEVDPDFGNADAVIGRYAERAEKAQITVLSAEGLSAPDPAFAQQLSTLQERFDLRIIVYLRRQDEWALSAYRQAVTHPAQAEHRSLGDWLCDAGVRARMDFDGLLRLWEEAFGAERLRVLRYPHDTPLITGFLEAAGLPVAASMLPGRGLRVNESRDDEAFLAALERNGMAKRLPDLSQPERDALLEDLRPSNNRVRERYFPHLHTLFGLG